MAMEDDEEQEENAEVPASEPGPSDAPAEGWDFTHNLKNLSRSQNP